MNILCFGAFQFHRNHIQQLQSFSSWCQAMRIMFMLNAQFHDLLNMLQAFVPTVFMLALYFGYHVAADSTNEQTCTMHMNSTLIFFLC